MRNDRAPARRDIRLGRLYALDTRLERLARSFCRLCEPMDAGTQGSDGVEVDLHTLRGKLEYGAWKEWRNLRIRCAGFLAGLRGVSRRGLGYRFLRGAFVLSQTLAYTPEPINTTRRDMTQKRLTRRSGSNSRAAETSFQYPQTTCPPVHRPSTPDRAGASARVRIPMGRVAAVAAIGVAERTVIVRALVAAESGRRVRRKWCFA